MIIQCQWCHRYFEIEEEHLKEIACSFCAKKTTLSLPTLGLLDTKTQAALHQMSQKIHRLWWALLFSWSIGIAALLFTLWK